MSRNDLGPSSAQVLGGRRSKYQDTSREHGRTQLSNGQIVKITLEDYNRAYLEAQAAEVRKVLRAARGYTSRWPKPRYNRKGRRASRLMFNVKAKFRPRQGTMYLFVRHKQRHGVLLETRSTIRGYDNVHWRAAMRTVGDNWRKLSAVASNDVARRARGRAIRRLKAQERAAQRDAASAGG